MIGLISAILAIALLWFVLYINTRAFEKRADFIKKTKKEWKRK